MPYAQQIRKKKIEYKNDDPLTLTPMHANSSVFCCCDCCKFELYGIMNSMDRYSHIIRAGLMIEEWHWLISGMQLQ